MGYSAPSPHPERPKHYSCVWDRTKSRKISKGTYFSVYIGGPVRIRTYNSDRSPRNARILSMNVCSSAASFDCIASPETKLSLASGCGIMGPTTCRVLFDSWSQARTADTASGSYVSDVWLITPSQISKELRVRSGQLTTNKSDNVRNALLKLHPQKASDWLRCHHLCVGLISLTDEVQVNIPYLLWVILVIMHRRESCNLDEYSSGTSYSLEDLLVR